MELFGIEKLSLVDYDGKVASTVFTATCNFLCPFCQNSPLVTDAKNLTAIPEEEVLDYFSKRRGVLDGVCITGGEPTLQKDLPEFCKKVKDLGLSVKVDTNGTNPQMVKYLYENGLCDYFAVDIKNAKENYAKIIGFKTFDTKKVEETVNYLMTSGVDYEFRTTLVKEFHTASDMENIGKWIKGAKNYALQKFKDTGSCIESGLNPVDDNTAKEFLEIVKKYVPNAKLRGY